MNTIDLAQYEIDRLAELYSINILDTPEEAEYNSLAELLAFVTGCPISLVSIMDKDRQWFKAKLGVRDKETDRSIAFCNHTIEANQLFVVEDATKDERFKNNPMVSGAHHFRFYAGVPIYSPSGHTLGTVCVLDTVPRVLTQQQLKAVEAVAKQASKLIELHKQNQQVLRLTRSMLDVERKTIHYQIKQQEEERELLGTELHENFAQTVAAALHYLKMAGSEPQHSGPYIEKVNTILTDLFESMCQLSYAIYPMGSVNVGSEEKLRKLFRDFEELTGDTIRFTCKGDLDLLPPKKISHLFRMIMEYLHAIEKIAGIKKTFIIELSVCADVELKMWEQGFALQEGHRRQVVTNIILKHCELFNGTVTLQKSKQSDCLYILKIPLN